MFYEILQRDEKLIGNLWKATKLIYFAVHPGKKQTEYYFTTRHIS